MSILLLLIACPHPYYNTIRKGCANEQYTRRKTRSKRMKFVHSSTFSFIHFPLLRDSFILFLLLFLFPFTCAVFNALHRATETSYERRLEGKREEKSWAVKRVVVAVLLLLFGVTREGAKDEVKVKNIFNLFASEHLLWLLLLQTKEEKRLHKNLHIK